jgi:hypothetical protein
MRPTADMLNKILADGGTVQVTTYTRSVLYRAKHAGMFIESRERKRNGLDAHTDLCVRRGRNVDRLSHGGMLLVSIRTSVPVNS